MFQPFGFVKSAPYTRHKPNFILRIICMRFEETKDVVTIPKFGKVFVYFLLLDDDVVYVGQTKHGLSRPLAHTDKEYDEIKIIYCEERNLDLLEDTYIKKYKPYYNKALNHSMNYSLTRARNKIRRYFNDNTFNLPHLKRAIKILNIEVCVIDCKPHISIDDYKLIIKYMENQRGSENEK